MGEIGSIHQGLKSNILQLMSPSSEFPAAQVKLLPYFHKAPGVSEDDDAQPDAVDEEQQAEDGPKKRPQRKKKPPPPRQMTMPKKPQRPDVLQTPQFAVDLKALQESHPLKRLGTKTV